MGNGAEQRASQALGFDLYLGALCVLGAQRTFDGSRRLMRAGFEQLAQLGAFGERVRSDPEHAHGLVRAEERNIASRCRRSGDEIATCPGHLGERRFGRVELRGA